MKQNIMTVDDVTTLIASGKTLLLAGEEDLLKKLPKGKWIGGTIPYFIAPDDGGVICKDKIFVTDISDVAESIRVSVYGSDTLGKVYAESGSAGFCVIIIPAMSSVHSSFALNAPNYADFGCHPLVGWISGVHLDNLGKITPKVFDGTTSGVYEQEAVVMHVTVPKSLTVNVGIVNIFEQGKGDTLTFESDGFSCTDVMVNGVKENFVDYIHRNNLDTKLPLVADYYGALVNISFQSVDKDNGVAFYAPVFAGLRYKHAKPVEDYASLFEAQLQKNNVNGDKILFSCNCILNYLYSNLGGRKTGPFVGPITFGEVAYQLLNQTLVYIEALDSSAK